MHEKALPLANSSQSLQGVVTAVYHFGCFVEFDVEAEDGDKQPVFGMVHKSELSWDFCEDARLIVKVALCPALAPALPLALVPVFAIHTIVPATLWSSLCTVFAAFVACNTWQRQADKDASWASKCLVFLQLYSVNPISTLNPK